MLDTKPVQIFAFILQFEFRGSSVQYVQIRRSLEPCHSFKLKKRPCINLWYSPIGVGKTITNMPLAWRGAALPRTDGGGKTVDGACERDRSVGYRLKWRAAGVRSGHRRYGEYEGAHRRGRRENDVGLLVLGLVLALALQFAPVQPPLRCHQLFARVGSPGNGRAHGFFAEALELHGVDVPVSDHRIFIRMC